jgi:hypothetical protein
MRLGRISKNCTEPWSDNQTIFKFIYNRKSRWYDFKYNNEEWMVHGSAIIFIPKKINRKINIL